MSEEPKTPFDPNNNNLMLPRDRREVNAWTWHYYTTHPIVATWIDEIVNQLCSDFYLIKKSNMSDADFAKINNYFFKDGEFIFNSKCYDIVRELTINGEAFPYININKDNTLTVSVQNPNFIQVNTRAFGETSISLIADDQLKEIVESKDPKDKKLVKELDPEIIKLVKDNKPIPISSDYVSHLAIKNHPYDIRGSSRLIKFFKTLMKEDRLNEIAFEQGVVAPEIVSKEIKRECSSKAFEKSLRLQRDMIEKWIVERLIKVFIKTHRIKGDVELVWRDKIDADSIRDLFN